MVHLENIAQFLSKTQIAKSDQNKIRLEPYYPSKAQIFFDVQKVSLKRLSATIKNLTNIVLSPVLKKFSSKLGYFVLFKFLLKNCIWCVTV